MTRSLSKLVGNIAYGIYQTLCKYIHSKKNTKNVELNKNIISAILNKETLSIIY